MSFFPRVGILSCALSLSLVLASPADACHFPEHARMMMEQGHYMDEHVLTVLLNTESDFTQAPPTALEGLTTCTGGMAGAFPCEGIDLLALLSIADLGGSNASGADLWGWTDPLDGSEYALMSMANGVAFVDVTDPVNPVYLGRLNSHVGSSGWRDVKVFANHAFIVADNIGPHGMQVFDLTELRNVTSPPWVFTATARYDQFGSAHNIVINEATGYAYAVGSDTCSGGLHMIDISNPLSPSNAGCYSADGYTHDAQCVIYNGPDFAHQGKEICLASNEDTVTIIDVTNKANPVQLSRKTYSGEGYTHQGWMTEDHRYFLLDDELDEQFFGHNTKTYTWDISDLDDPTLAGFYIQSGSSIDHNQYIRDGVTYQANYRRGLRVFNIDDPSTGALSAAGFFDTRPENDGNGFSGAWSVYPYFDSGTLIVSDINRGLFVLRMRDPSSIFVDGFESGDISAWSGSEP